MQWMDRALIVSPIYYGLCLDEKDFKKTLKQLKVEEHVEFLLNDKANATVHFFTKDKDTAAVVCLGDTKGQSLEQIYSILVHEAIHIWQTIKEDMNEDSPSKELEAYSIQRIVLNLFISYKDQKKKKK